MMNHSSDSLGSFEPFVTRAALLLALPIVWCVALPYLLTENPPQLGGLCTTTVMFILLVTGQAFIMRVIDKRASAPSATPPPTRSRDLMLCLTGIVCVHAYALWNIEYFPIVLHGESLTTLKKSSMILSSFKDGNWLHLLRSYNLGLGFFHLPVLLFGESSMLTAQIVSISALGCALALFLWMFLRSSVAISYPILLLCPFVLSISLTCLRRYKWHFAAMVAALGIYLITLAMSHEKVNRTWFILGLFALALSVLMYHGVVLYLPVLLVILSVNYLITRTHTGYHAFLLTLLVGFGVAAAALLAYNPHFSYFSNRFSYEIDRGMDWKVFLRNWRSFFEIVHLRWLSLPLSIVSTVGLGAALARAWNDTFARVTLLLGAAMTAALIATYGFINFDENWFILTPLIAILFIGMREISSVLTLLPKRIGIIVAVALTLSIGAHELKHYYRARMHFILDLWVAPHSHEHLATLSLFDAREKLARGSPVVFFPARGIPLQYGGFENASMYSFPDFEPTFRQMLPYTSKEWLIEQLGRVGPSSSQEIYIYFARVALETELVEQFVGELEEMNYSVSIERDTSYTRFWAEKAPTVTYFKLRRTSAAPLSTHHNKT